MRQALYFCGRPRARRRAGRGTSRVFPPGWWYYPINERHRETMGRVTRQAMVVIMMAQTA